MAKQKRTEPTNEGWPIYELWAKYEDIAMHFNDLLIKLRYSQEYAVAAPHNYRRDFCKEWR